MREPTLTSPRKRRLRTSEQQSYQNGKADAPFGLRWAVSSEAARRLTSWSRREGPGRAPLAKSRISPYREMLGARMRQLQMATRPLPVGLMLRISSTACPIPVFLSRRGSNLRNRCRRSTCRPPCQPRQESPQNHLRTLRAANACETFRNQTRHGSPNLPGWCWIELDPTIRRNSSCLK